MNVRELKETLDKLLETKPEAANYPIIVSIGNFESEELFAVALESDTQSEYHSFETPIVTLWTEETLEYVEDIEEDFLDCTLLYFNTDRKAVYKQDYLDNL